MHKVVDRKITLSSDDVRRAIWLLLKDVDEPVPADDDDLQVSFIRSEKGPVEISVSWETRCMIPKK